ncbi:hypothetical protein HPB49_023933 [Dermacentor silvarum]|uniref:Uncharacterized protein n=1 Tax=Dermacentor silvarum TaxID=543639 RepID=A0ACB8DH31_DERSI|nr:hypothetical protein HPB49_023933 [Dermacentor silvarum]
MRTQISCRNVPERRAGTMGSVVRLLFLAVAMSMLLRAAAFPGLCIPVDYCDGNCVAGYDTAGCEVCVCPPCLPCPTDCYDPAPGCPDRAVRHLGTPYTPRAVCGRTGREHEHSISGRARSKQRTSSSAEVTIALRSRASIVAPPRSFREKTERPQNVFITGQHRRAHEVPTDTDQTVDPAGWSTRYSYTHDGGGLDRKEARGIDGLLAPPRAQQCD